MTDLGHLFALEIPVWEMALRGSAVYWFLFVMFRFVLRRDIGSMGVADLLFVVLVADAASNAMQGDYKTIGDGMVLLGTLAGWNYLMDWLSFRFERVSRFLEPPPETLIKHGKLMHKVLKRAMITVDELTGKLREQGVERLGEVRRARMESDGTLSVLTYETRPGRKHPPPDNSQVPPGR